MLVNKANELLKPYGITDAYTYFLMELYQQEGLTQSEMHKQIGIEQPTAVKTLDRMERDGLIIRVRSISDRRVITIHLTQKGINLQPIIKECAEKLNQQAFHTFQDKEKKILGYLLKKLHGNF